MLKNIDMSIQLLKLLKQHKSSNIIKQCLQKEKKEINDFIYKFQEVTYIKPKIPLISVKYLK